MQSVRLPHQRSETAWIALRQDSACSLSKPAHTRCSLARTANRTRTCTPVLARDQRESGFRNDLPVTMDESYVWPIEADTHQLSSGDWVQSYFCERIREICWDLGILDVATNALNEFVENWAFR